MMACINCAVETRKYKCTKCTAPYCSLNCFKTHIDSTVCKERQEEMHTTLKEGPQIPSVDEEPTLFEPFGTNDTVTREQLEQLRHCQPLHELLYNSHLRNLLQEIDVAPNAWRAMKAAMQVPLFLEFADECLKVIEPMSEAERKELSLN